MHWAPEGAYTGEMSIRMLQPWISISFSWAMPNAADFHENDADLNRKVLAALDAGLRVLFALGETAEERSFGVGGETVLRQLKIGLHGVRREQLDLLRSVTSRSGRSAREAFRPRRQEVQPMAALVPGSSTSMAIRRGDADLVWRQRQPENAATFTSLPDIDGLFVGRAGWTVDGYIATYLGGIEGYRAHS